MSEAKDLIIIGAGPGGYVAAIRAAQLGLKVALVEKDARLGGTCTLRGCIPTKALLHTAELLDSFRRADRFGISVEGAELDLEGAQSYKDDVVSKNAKGIEFLMNKNEVELLRGFGRVAGPHEVEVRGDEGSVTHPARNILIATGSVPREIPPAPTDGERIVNSDHILETTRVPESLIVIGAGAVGTEFASMFASFGSEVVLVEMLPRILPVEDEEASKEVARAFRKRKIKVLTGTKLAEVESTEGGVRVSLEGEDGEGSAEAEQLLVAVGRAPITEGLGLEDVGVRLESDYVQVNEFMQTEVPHIYAIGDVVQTPWLAHVASAEGIVVAEHVAGAGARALDYDLVPSVTYCDPEVGSVGLSEAEAGERGHDVAVGKFPFTALGKARIIGKTEGFVKVVRETRYDQVLGVHIVGAHATDLIAEACVAMQLESTTEEIFRAIHAHPTLSEAMAEAAHAAVGHAIHF